MRALKNAHLRAGMRVLLSCIIAAAASVFLADAATAQDHLLADPFQDHAVVQRDRPIALWGYARAGERVTVTMNGHSTTARADHAGAWRATLPALAAGGPYVIEARTASGASQRVSDVLVGDVFLCSGQSNMEFSVSAANHGRFELARAANDRLRVMNVAHATSPHPLTSFSSPTPWAIASADSIANFSAACYFFGRELQGAVHVPIGLIDSSWGGARIEPWMTAQSLRPLDGYRPQLDLLALYVRDHNAGLQGLGETWQNWWRAAAPQEGEPWLPNANGDWRALPEPMRDWRTWGVPETVDLKGMVWFRRTVVLTAAQAAQASTIALGGIDEVDNTWINGRYFANTFGWGDERVYPAPAGTFHAGENTIVVNVLSTYDAGGMYGPPERMHINFAGGESVPLGGDWRYRLVPSGVTKPPRAPWESVSGLTGMYNAMIAPLGAYGVRGIAWYQGESNTGDARRYETLLASWMAGWRAQFGAQTPFLIVQLPNYGPAVVRPAESDWASLREAQRRAVAADQHAALVVTIDVGDPAELHPLNKQAVGARMARAARHLIYGESISPSGPIPLRARRVGDQVVVRFGDIEGALVAYSAAGPNGFELCGAGAGSCRFVTATLQGDTVSLPAAGEARRVRYCWGDSPLCNLFDGAGLPAGPFELEVSN